jgi:hypothetical protein
VTSAANGDDWARAQAVLDRLPPEAAERRARRVRLERRLTRLGVAVTAVAVGTLLVLLVVDRDSPPGDAPPWRVADGFAVQAIGLVLMIAVHVAHSGAVRHTRGWGRPMHWLSRREHKELVRQVRGKDPLVPEQLPLARHTAGMVLVQRPPLAAPSAFLLVVVGQYIAMPDTVRFLLAAAMAVAVVAAEVHVRRDVRRTQRFLAENQPAPGAPPPGG